VAVTLVLGLQRLLNPSAGLSRIPARGSRRPAGERLARQNETERYKISWLWGLMTVKIAKQTASNDETARIWPATAEYAQGLFNSSPDLQKNSEQGKLPLGEVPANIRVPLGASLPVPPAWPWKIQARLASASTAKLKIKLSSPPEDSVTSPR